MTKEWKDIASSPIFLGPFFALWIAGAIFYVVDYWRTDPDLKYEDRMDAISAAFEKEIDAMGVPERTGINVRHRAGGKRLVAITCERRYRTGLAPEEFEAFFRDRLLANGWVYTRTDESDESYERVVRFSRGKFDAAILLESRWRLFGDGGTYFVVELSLRKRRPT